MYWEEAAVTGLRNSDVDLVAYIPDSLTDGLIDRIIDDDALKTVRVAREEEAISLLTGVWLGGGRGALICQSSGLANCFNAIGSHALPYQLPFLGLVTRRGAMGERNRAQVPAGYALPQLLDTLGVRTYSLEDDESVAEEVTLAADSAFATKVPYVLFLERVLTGGKYD